MNAMFLDSLIEPGCVIPRRRWTTIVSFVLQAAGIGVLVLLPLFYTGALPPVRLEGAAVLFPHVRANTPHVNVITVHEPAAQGIQAPRFIPAGIYIPKEPEIAPEEPGIVITGIGVGTGSGGEASARRPELTVLLNAPPPMPRLAASTPPPISSGVMEGLLVRRVEPRYPYTALVARIEGTVVLTAVISSEGKVEQLQARSGHPLLIPAAIDAVREWRYRPYLLNGKPTEVEAQITVSFHLQR